MSRRDTGHTNPAVHRSTNGREALISGGFRQTNGTRSTMRAFERRPDTARWISTGGWGVDEHEIAVRSFRRVTRAEYEAAGRRALESLAPPAPSTQLAE